MSKAKADPPVPPETPVSLESQDAPVPRVFLALWANWAGPGPLVCLDPLVTADHLVSQGKLESRVLPVPWGAPAFLAESAAAPASATRW